MFHQLVTASRLLCLLTISVAGQQQLKGGQLDRVAHVGAFPTNPLSALSDSLTVVKGSKSVSKIALDESLSGYGVDATYSDNTTCTTFAAAMVYPLNACFFFSGPVGFTNAKITATSSSYTLQQFSDEKCSVMSGSATTTPYASTCGANGQKYFVQPSKDVATSLSLAYLG